MGAWVESKEVATWCINGAAIEVRPRARHFFRNTDDAMHFVAQSRGVIVPSDYTGSPLDATDHLEPKMQSPAPENKAVWLSPENKAAAPVASTVAPETTTEAPKAKKKG
jgi:hypothetical protein